MGMEGNQFQRLQKIPSRHTTPHINNNFHITQPYNFNGFNLWVLNIPNWFKVNTLKKAPKNFYGPYGPPLGHHDNKSLIQGSFRDNTQKLGTILWNLGFMGTTKSILGTQEPKFRNLLTL